MREALIGALAALAAAFITYFATVYSSAYVSCDASRERDNSALFDNLNGIYDVRDRRYTFGSNIQDIPKEAIVRNCRDTLGSKIQDNSDAAIAKCQLGLIRNLADSEKSHLPIALKGATLHEMVVTVDAILRKWGTLGGIRPPDEPKKSTNESADESKLQGFLPRALLASYNKFISINRNLDDWLDATDFILPPWNEQQKVAAFVEFAKSNDVGIGNVPTLLDLSANGLIPAEVCRQRALEATFLLD